MVLKRRLIRTGIIFALLVAYPFAVHFGAKAWFLWKTQYFAGIEAIACGHTNPRRDPSQIVSCMNDAIANNRPFWGILNYRGIDSTVASGVARNVDGTTNIISYDSNPGGFCLYFCSPRIKEKRCIEPSVLAEKFSPEVALWSIKVTCDPS